MGGLEHSDGFAAASVLDALPYGVVAVSPGCDVLGANATAHELLPGIGEEGMRRCSELFDCRGPGRPCEHGCLAVRSSDGALALPEVRIDTPGGAKASALWVTAAPLRHQAGALLHLRPGDARDRRRRSEPHWLAGPELRIRAFGKLTLESDAGTLDGKWLGERPGQLLKYLVCERRRVATAEAIAEAIWPGGGRHAVGNIRHVVHRLRDKLEPRRAGHGQSSFIVAVPGGYTLDLRRTWVDVDEFQHCVEDGLAAMGRGDRPVSAERLERALELYRGDFLADEPYADWAAAERNRLCRLAARAASALAVLAKVRGDRDAVVEHLERLCELEPFDTDVHRQLIDALRTAGRRSEAKRRYTAFASRVRREFAEEPDFDLRSPPDELAS